MSSTIEDVEVCDPIALKEAGNEAFKSERYAEAVDYYRKAIKAAEARSDGNAGSDLAVFYKNLAAAHLKSDAFEAALDACDKSLGYGGNDPKALFRRAQALEGLGRFEEAYRDARQVLQLEPTNKPVQPVLERLHRIVQERLKINAQAGNKVEGMKKILFDLTADKEKREAAVNNLLVLSKENAGAEALIKSGLLIELKKLLKVEKNKSIFIAAIRIIGELSKYNPERTLKVLKVVGIPWFLEILDSENDDQVNSAQYCMQAILNTFSGMTNKPDSKPNQELCTKYKQEIHTLLSCLVYSVNNRSISGKSRDAIIELLMKNIHYNQLNWAEELLNIGGVQRLLECASELEEYKYESSMNITASTRTITAVCLSRIYENMYYDLLKEKFMGIIDEFIREKLLSPDIESKVRATVTITTLLRGPIDVGNSIISKEGILEMVLVMANTRDDELQQKVAVECIVAAASKADKAKAIIAQGIDILKGLYKSGSDGVRVRALVGLCKLGSSGGTDVSLKPFDEGSNLKLAEACRKFLLHPSKGNDLRKWAAEGLSYLTLDAEVKERLCEDKPALQSLIELAKSGDQSVLFGVITTLVNLCNAYDKQEILPEMLEIAKFAKQHIPEEHELDDPDFVSKRILTLGNLGVASALVALSKTDSDNSRESISRVFNALCSEPSLRGNVVQQGGVKALLKLSLKGSERGKRFAGQALARIAITNNPEVAFPGQRALEVIRPLLNLLHPDCTALENFEALMGLCNIAQIDETARKRILKEGGFSKIEHYVYEDHLMLCRAAVQCITNLTLSEDVVKIYEGENDKMKILVALCADEDPETVKASSGALAILTSSSEICCQKIFDLKSWLDAIRCLLGNECVDVRHRGTVIVRNMFSAARDVAEKLVETDILEILMALVKLDGEEMEKVRKTAEEALAEAEKMGVIKKPEEGLGEGEPSLPEVDEDA